MKQLLLVLLFFGSACQFDEDLLDIPSDARLVTTDVEAFRDCEQLYKEGDVWVELRYAGFGSAFVNGEKAVIYPFLAHSNEKLPDALILQFFTPNLKKMIGNLYSYDIQFSNERRYNFVKANGGSPTSFHAKYSQCYSYGAYHIADSLDHRSYIKMVEFDDQYRLKARFNLVLEVNEEHKAEIDKAGLPHRLVISDGVVMAGFLEALE